MAKHRHKLAQRSRAKASDRSHEGAHEDSGEQVTPGKSKKRQRPFVEVEGRRPQPRLDRRSRSPAKPRKYDIGGGVAPGASGPGFQNPSLPAGVNMAGLGHGPPPAPAPYVDDSVGQLLGQIMALKNTGAFDKPPSNNKSGSSSKDSGDSSNNSNNRRGGRVPGGRSALRRERRP